MIPSIIDARPNWHDGFDNGTDVTFRADAAPSFAAVPAKKVPCAAERLSGEQRAIVGGRPKSAPSPGWHIYWQELGPFVSFFTWGGKPDDGFGGSRRKIILEDGGTEDVVGGWHVSPRVAEDAGLPPVIEVAVVAPPYDDRWPFGGGLAMFMKREAWEQAVEEFLPDCEIVNGEIKWKGQISKRHFQAVEHLRRAVLRDELKAKYPLIEGSGSAFGADWTPRRDWHDQATDEERAQLSSRPYSALGAKCIILSGNRGDWPQGRQVQMGDDLRKAWRCSRCHQTFTEPHPTSMGSTCAFEENSPLVSPWDPKPHLPTYDQGHAMMTLRSTPLEVQREKWDLFAEQIPAEWLRTGKPDSPAFVLSDAGRVRLNAWLYEEGFLR